VDVARERKMDNALAEGLARTRVAAVGPIVENALKPLGVSPIAVPAENFHLKPMIKAITMAVGR
jgi:uroporphyrinogen-III synthase